MAQAITYSEANWRLLCVGRTSAGEMAAWGDALCLRMSAAAGSPRDLQNPGVIAAQAQVEEAVTRGFRLHLARFGRLLQLPPIAVVWILDEP